MRDCRSNPFGAVERPHPVDRTGMARNVSALVRSPHSKSGSPTFGMCCSFHDSPQNVPQRASEPCQWPVEGRSGSKFSASSS